MQAAIGDLIDRSTDRVRIYLLCADCGRRIRIIGQGVQTSDEEAYVV